MKHLYLSLLFVCTLFTETKAQVDVGDSLALVDFYNSTDGPNWRRNDNWLHGPADTWWGITIFNRRVTKISLSNNKLLGYIPESFGSLNELNVLRLGSNNVRSLPESFGNLINLYLLWLPNNQLTSLPESFGNLSLLSYLDLDNNQLMSLPESFVNLSTLISLSLNHNELSALPETVGKLSWLRYLFLSHNQLSSLPESMGNLSFLLTLHLDSNQLSSLPESIGNLTLYSLTLNNNQFADSLPSSLLYLNKYDMGYFPAYNNKLTFDIEPMVSYFYNFFYSPQSNIKLKYHENTLSISAGGTLSNNTYNWYKDGQLVATTIGDSTYAITVDGAYNVNVTNSICTTLTLYSDTINTGILPLTLLNFTAALQNKNALLNWSTSNEINTAYFNIQRSTDGIHFSNIGKLNAQGSSTSTAQYSFTDAGIAALAANKIFYRLQLTDKNGSYQYSKIIALDIASMQNDFVVYPNPVKDVLHLQLNGTATFVLSNSEGKILLTKIVNGSGEINVAALPAGLYYLKNIETGEVKKVIVK